MLLKKESQINFLLNFQNQTASDKHYSKMIK